MANVSMDELIAVYANAGYGKQLHDLTLEQKAATERGLSAVLELIMKRTQRQPLTDAEIEIGRDATFSINNPFCPCDSKTMRKAVRWAERKHGIV